MICFTLGASLPFAKKSLVKAVPSICVLDVGKKLDPRSACVIFAKDSSHPPGILMLDAACKLLPAVDRDTHIDFYRS